MPNQDDGDPPLPFQDALKRKTANLARADWETMWQTTEQLEDYVRAWVPIRAGKRAEVIKLVWNIQDQIEGVIGQRRQQRRRL